MDVEAFWNACAPVTDAECRRWLAGRAINPEHVAARDMARALTASVRCPRWARFGGATWFELGYRCIIPMYDASGTLRSLRARYCGEVERGVPKALVPDGLDGSGLVMACSFGADMLRTGHLPTVRGKHFVLVGQGETDFLTIADPWGATPHHDGIAMIGLSYGEPWSQEIADRIPSGVEVTIWPKPNLYGALVARACSDAVRGRLVVRWQHRDVLRECLSAVEHNDGDKPSRKGAVVS